MCSACFVVGIVVVVSSQELYNNYNGNYIDYMLIDYGGDLVNSINYDK